ncbi:MAG: DUF2764 domain-containing protein [Verrucomicrobiota bacterium]|jgi:hypothetical protein|nr:DUF2764 domain-containing protein [Verrucomicrobiota bacterium]
MGGYNYLVSSLPALALGSPPPFTPEDFLFHTQGVLSEADQAELAAVLSGHPERGYSGFARMWSAGDTQIRNTIAKARGAKLGVEVKPFLHSHPGYSVWLDKDVSDALAKSNPLESEMGLDAARWKYVDDLALADPTGLPGVLAFAVKLMLVSRWSGMDEKAGRERLEQLVSDLEEQAPQAGS